MSGEEGLSNRHVFSRRFYLFVEQTLLSHRTDTNFPRNPYLVLEHIQIFQEPLFLIKQILIFQETLSSPRPHTIFQETPMPQTDTYFSGRYPLSNRYFANRSRWVLSKIFTTVLILSYFHQRLLIQNGKKSRLRDDKGLYFEQRLLIRDDSQT